MATSLSRRKRVLFFLLALFAGLVVAFAIWRVQLARDVVRRLAALRAQGLPTSGAELNQWYAAVPDAENAALVITQALALMRSYPDDRSNEVALLELPASGQHLTPQQRDLLSGYVERNAAAIAKARDAVALTNSRYPIDLSSGFETTLPHLTQMKTLALVLRDEALCAADAGRVSETVPSLVTIVANARTLEPEPLLISQLVRIASLRIATGTLERSLNLGPLDEPSLQRLAEVFAGAEKTNQMVRSLIGERAAAIPCFNMTWADINRIADADKNNEMLPNERRPSNPHYPLSVLIRGSGFFERDLRFYLSFMDTAIASTALGPPRSLEANAAFDDMAREVKKHHYILTGMLAPALGAVSHREAASLADLRATRTAIAVERFRAATGRLPETLTELTPRFLEAIPIDPFNAEPLRYRRLEKGYVVYSVGEDRQDDHGTPKPPGLKRGDKVPSDLTFTVGR